MRKIIIKLDQALMAFMFLFVVPAICILSVMACVELHHLLNDEMAEAFILAAGILSCAFLAGLAANIVAGLVTTIFDWVHRKKVKRYYKEHPEEERKRKERIAKNFEELAKIIMEDKEKE